MEQALTTRQLLSNLRECGYGEAVLARVERLNPKGLEFGALIRGIHYPKSRYLSIWHMPKGRFIRMFGRDAWSHLRKYHKVRDGRRQYATQEAVEDRIWELWQGKWPLRDGNFTDIGVVEPDEFQNSRARKNIKYYSPEEFEKRFIKRA